MSTGAPRANHTTTLTRRSAPVSLFTHPMTHGTITTDASTACILAVARVALAAGTAAAAVAGLTGLGGLLELHLRGPDAEDDGGGLHGGAALLQVRVHLAATFKSKLSAQEITELAITLVWKR